MNKRDELARKYIDQEWPHNDKCVRLTTEELRDEIYYGFWQGYDAGFEECKLEAITICVRMLKTVYGNTAYFNAVDVSEKIKEHIEQLTPSEGEGG